MKFWSVLLFIACLSNCSAQNAYEVNYQLGRVIPNSGEFPKVNAFSHNIEFSLLRQTENSKFKWPRLYKFPPLAYSINLQTLGNADQIGYAIGLNPNIGIYLRRRKNHNIQMRLGLGVAYLSRYFDSIRNPENRAIGSAINFYMLMKFQYELRLSKKLILQTGFSFTHYSNGNLTTPNLGVNTPSLFIGLQYQPVPAIIPEPINALAVHPSVSKKIRPFIRGSISLVERAVDGPNYPAYSLALGAYKCLNLKNIISAGVEITYTYSNYHFINYVGIAEGTDAHLLSSRLQTFISYEFLFGNLAVIAEGGLYLSRHYDRRSVISTKVGIKYYWRKTNNDRHRFYSGAMVRAYFGDAEYVDWTMGFQF